MTQRVERGTESPRIVPAPAQHLDQPIADFFIVFDDQNS